MREIVFDTETTGLDHLSGDRLIEIGCVELLNHIPTGRTFHKYLNPRRAVSAGAGSVHGLTDEFLRGQPCFENVVDAFIEFVGDSKIVAHNAGFDRGFVNMELGLCGRPLFEEQRFVDTLLLARRRHPNGPNSLDALCQRYGIDNSARTLHGALLDAEILAEVYLELLGGRQATLALGTLRRDGATFALSRGIKARARSLPLRLTPAEADQHAAFVAKLGGAAVWNRYLVPEEAGRAA
jgi:DNA polymerase-3 subunit epsilon